MSEQVELKKQESAEDAGAGAGSSETNSPAKTKANVGLQHHVINTERCGTFNVYVQGDLDEARREKDCKCVFLTVHDIGNNHRSMVRYFEHDSFEEIKKRAILIHICVPGQEDGAEEFPDDFVFPRLQMMGEDLIAVLDQLRIKCCIGIGDGAGANIIVRFGMMHVTRCLGVVLIHPVGNASTIMESFKDKFNKWKIGTTGENIIAFRKFGHKLDDAAEDKENALQEFKSKLGMNVTRKNLNLFMDAYLNRKDIISRLEKELTCDTLVVVGSKSAHVSAAETMFSKMDKTRSSLLKVDGVGNVLEEAPAKLAHSVLLFCKGLGWLTSVQLPGVDRRSSVDNRRSSVDSQGQPRRQRTVSMEEYDTPNIRRLSMGKEGLE